MARHCAICFHAERQLIDRAILAGEKLASISRRWGLPPDATERHAKLNHVDRTLSKVPTRAEEALRSEGEDLVGRLRELIQIARDVLGRAIGANQYGAAMAGVRELARIFELIAKLTGQLDEGARVNILVAQQQQHEAEQELQLSRLTIEERRQLRYLYAKMQGEVPVPEISVTAPALAIVEGDVNGAAQPFARSD
jgi:hypothetical protein